MATNPMQVQESLRGVDFPCSKADLLKYARDKGVSKDVLAALNGLPDREYKGPQEVLEAMGGS